MNRCFFATAARGTASALADELRELGLAGVRMEPSGTHFRGALPDAWRVCLNSRIALSVILHLAQGDAPSPEALYAVVSGVDWSPYLTPNHTLAVSAVCRDSRMTHSGYVALRTKDAIVDQVRARCGARPSVERDDPDVKVFVRIFRDRAWIGLDLAGQSLHRRGYRGATGAAPLRETLAAAVLRLGGWNRRTPFLDPLCGSGTLAIEAALWAGGRAPGLLRERFGFERWASHDQGCAGQMAALRAEARATAHPPAVEIFAGDADPRVIEHARAAARRADVDICFYTGAVERSMPRFAGPAFIAANPPYGHRLAGGPALYADLAEAFRKRRGDTVALLAGHPALARAMGRRPDQTWELLNGNLACRLLLYHSV